MTSLTPRARKERLLRIFARSGGEGSRIRAFESFPEQVRERVRGEAEPSEREELILASYNDENNWTLLTSEQLIAKRASVAIRLGWSEISDATADLNEARTALAASKQGKLHLTRLWVVRPDGGRLELSLEPGPSFIAFWNVLKTVAVLTESR